MSVRKLQIFSLPLCRRLRVSHHPGCNTNHIPQSLPGIFYNELNACLCRIPPPLSFHPRSTWLDACSPLLHPPFTSVSHCLLLLSYSFLFQSTFFLIMFSLSIPPPSWSSSLFLHIWCHWNILLMLLFSGVAMQNIITKVLRDFQCLTAIFSTHPQDSTISFSFILFLISLSALSQTPCLPLCLIHGVSVCPLSSAA